MSEPPSGRFCPAKQWRGLGCFFAPYGVAQLGICRLSLSYQVPNPFLLWVCWYPPLPDARDGLHEDADYIFSCDCTARPRARSAHDSAYLHRHGEGRFGV